MLIEIFEESEPLTYLSVGEDPNPEGGFEGEDEFGFEEQQIA